MPTPDEYRRAERHENLESSRTEYALLFPHFHFLQGLRFAMFGASLPMFGALFAYYVNELQDGSDSGHPITAGAIALFALCLLHALYTVNSGIMRLTEAAMSRGIRLEELLKVSRGTFASMAKRLRIPDLRRTSGMIEAAYFLGTFLWIWLLVRALLVLLG